MTDDTGTLRQGGQAQTGGIRREYACRTAEDTSAADPAQPVPGRDRADPAGSSGGIRAAGQTRGLRDNLRNRGAECRAGLCAGIPHRTDFDRAEPHDRTERAGFPERRMDGSARRRTGAGGSHPARNRRSCAGRCRDPSMHPAHRGGIRADGRITAGEQASAARRGKHTRKHAAPERSALCRNVRHTRQRGGGDHCDRQTHADGADFRDADGYFP